MNFHKVTAESIESIKIASTAKKALLYRKLFIKYSLICQKIFFNQNCLKNKVIPKYINVNLNSKCKSFAANSALEFAKVKWLKGEVKSLFIVRDNIKLNLKILHSELVHILHPIEWDIFDDSVRTLASELSHSKRLTLNKKLDFLIESNKVQSSSKNQTPEKFSSHKFFDRVVNLSSHKFNDSEMNLLSKGLKFNISNSKLDKCIENLAVDLDVALFKQPVAFKHICAQQIKELDVNSLKSSNTDMRTAKNIKDILSRENLTLTKADKGNSVVILSALDYNLKVEDFLSKGDHFQLLNKDPTSKFQEEVKTCVKNCPIIFHSTKFKVINLNPQPPRLFGLPKLHKPAIPIRPVVSFCSAPSYKIARELNAVFTSYNVFKPTYTVKNSIDFTNRIKDLKLTSNCKLVSFDVTNLFTNVPTDECKNIVSEILTFSDINSNVVKEMLRLFNICIEQNYFLFNQKFYKQSVGLPMGGPISPLLADIFMDYFENNLFKSNHPLLKNIKTWYRYVDDIFCIWTGTDRQLDIFLQYINSLHKNIKFTLEIEQQKTLNFLDITIKINNKNILEFAIYRKPTYTDVIIPARSLHPWSQKLSSFHAMINRLVNIPLTPINFDLELNIIKQIAVNNGYSTDLVINLLKRKQTKKLVTNNIFSGEGQTNDTIKNWRKIIYLGDTSSKIVKFLPENIEPAFYTVNNLGKILLNSKDRVESLSQSGIYRLSCGDCQASYVGQTGRNFNIRIKEHIRCLKSNNFSEFANHLIENEHNFNHNTNVEILHRVNKKGLKMNSLEFLEINKSINNKEILLNNILNKTGGSPLLNIFSNGLTRPN